MSINILFVSRFSNFAAYFTTISLLNIFLSKSFPNNTLKSFSELTNQGPIVQSVVSLTSSLRVIPLTVLADSIYNILIFFAEKKNVFSAKNFSIFAYHSM